MNSHQFNALIHERNQLQEFLDYSKRTNLLTSVSHLAIKSRIVEVDAKIAAAQEENAVLAG